jgi:hypothetical protein
MGQRNLFAANRRRANNVVSEIMGQGYEERTQILNTASQPRYGFGGEKRRFIEEALDKVGITTGLAKVNAAATNKRNAGTGRGPAMTRRVNNAANRREAESIVEEIMDQGYERKENIIFLASDPRYGFGGDKRRFIEEALEIYDL